MKVTKFCKNCGAGLKAGREDRVFCDDKCAAEYHRSQTPDYEHAAKVPGHEHAEKERKYGQKCQYCGERFVYNDYGARGGKREPLYCSNNHRQAAYRCRKAGKKTPYEEQVDQHDDWDRYDGHGGYTNKQQQQQQQQAPPPLRSARKQTFEEVLGVAVGCQWSEITARWKLLVVANHPDKHPGEEAVYGETLKSINEAYQALKRKYGKNVKQDRV